MLKVLLFAGAAALIGYGVVKREKKVPQPGMHGLIEQPDQAARTEGNLAIGAGALIIVCLLAF